MLRKSCDKFGDFLGSKALNRIYVTVVVFAFLYFGVLTAFALLKKN